MTRQCTLLGLFLCILCCGTLAANGQIKARTELGESVLLYPNGTWTYDYGNPQGWEDPYRGRPINPKDSKVYIERDSSGKSAEIQINGEVAFTLINGMLDNIRILDRFGRVVYDYKTGHVTYTSGTEVQYDFENRIIRFGKYDIKYSFPEYKIEKFGPYTIDYEFPEERVKRIGKYTIEYDFFTDRIKRIGNVVIDFDSFHERIRSVKGANPGMIISIF